MMERLKSLPASARFLIGMTCALLGYGILSDLIDDQGQMLEEAHEQLAAAELAIDDRESRVQQLDREIALRRGSLERLARSVTEDAGEIVDAEIISDVQDLPQAAR